MALLPGSGGSGMDELKDDATPELGGPLDVDGQIITSSDGGNVVIDPNGTGNIELGSFVFDADQTVGAGQDNYVLTYDNGTGLITLEATASSGLTDIVDDTTPQLGGNLDANSYTIQFDDNTGIQDDSGNELLWFQKATSAVNYIEISNSITGGPPGVQATGSDASVDLSLNAKGFGRVQLGTHLDVNGADIQSPDGTDRLRLINGSLDIQTASTSRVDITDSGLRLGGANARVTTVLDEDTLSSDSATALATQQSIKAYVDGQTYGITDVVSDTTPQLGGDLDLNGNQITSPDGTDLINIPNGSIDLQTASTSRLDISDSGVRLGAANARVTTILDEDTMSSDSATALATQQSIKAYVDAAGGGGTNPVVSPGIPSNYYFVANQWSRGFQGSTSYAGDTLFAFPCYIGVDGVTWTRIGIEVATTGAGTLARLGLYESNSSGQPGALITDYGTVATNSTGDKEITISETLTSGYYFFVIFMNGNSVLREDGSNYSPNFTGRSGGHNPSSDQVSHYTRALTYTTLPDPFGTPTAVTDDGVWQQPTCWLRKV